MIKPLKLTSLCILSLSMLLTLVGCTPAATTEPAIVPEEPEASQPTAPPPAEESTEPVVMRFGWKDEPDCMANIYTCGTIYFLSEILWEGINGLGPNCSLIPRLAKSVDLTNDGKTFTFHLNEGIMWSDGERFTTEDMKQHWDWITTKTIGDWYWITSKAESWKDIDEFTFELTLSQPDSSFLNGYTIWNWVLPPQVYGDFTEDDIWTYTTDNPVTTGPYQLTEWERGSYMIFDALPDYHLGKPPIDRIVVQFFANEDAMVNALLSGDIDVIPGDLSPQYYDTLAADPNITIYQQPPGRILYLDFNLREEVEGFDKHPAILDPVVREAIDYALNKQQIIDVALFGHGYLCPTASTCGPLTEWPAIDPGLQVFPQDFEKANQLLDDAGYIDTDDDGVREAPDGRPMAWSLYFDVDTPPSQPTAALIKEWAAEIGIAIEPEAMEGATLINRQVFTGEYEMALRSWVNEYDPGVLGDLFSCDAGMPFTGYCSERFDDALHKAQLSYGDERRGHVDEMDLILQEERPYIHLAGIGSLGGYHSEKLEMPADACPYYGGLISWYAVMNTVVK
jgi:peptide/nickel transport system substrate-binding protein